MTRTGRGLEVVGREDAAPGEGRRAGRGSPSGHPPWGVRQACSTHRDAGGQGPGPSGHGDARRLGVGVTVQSLATKPQKCSAAPPGIQPPPLDWEGKPCTAHRRSLGPPDTRPMTTGPETPAPRAGPERLEPRSPGAQEPRRRGGCFSHRLWKRPPRTPSRTGGQSLRLQSRAKGGTRMVERCPWGQVTRTSVGSPWGPHTPCSPLGARKPGGSTAVPRPWVSRGHKVSELPGG